MKRAFFIGSTLAALSSLILGCGGGSTPTELTVEVTEWEVRPAIEVSGLQSGRVTFVVTNAGRRPHELTIVKSDSPPEQLPLLDGLVDTDKLEVKGGIEPVGAGQTGEFTVNLSGGKYVLICNLIERPPGMPVEGHYQFGMNAALLVD